MFRDLPQYELRSDRDIPWMPPLPRHWSIERGKALFRRVQREPNASDGVVTCFRDGVVTLRSRRRTTGFTESLKEIGYQGIRRGDLVIHAMDAFAGAVGVSDSDGKGTPVYSVCVPRGKANPYYFAGVVREMARTSWIHSLAKGVRERSTDFRFDAFAVQQLPVPPVEEQAAIVKYLAHANTRIDKAIAAKRRLIALLEEQWRTEMRSAVLGRDHSDRADSGLHWVSKVPTSWRVRKLRSLFVRQGSGTTPAGDAYFGGGVPWVMSGDLNNGLLLDTARTVTDAALREISSLRMHPAGSLVIAMYGATIGKTGILAVDASTNQACSVLSEPRPGIDVRFVQLMLSVARPALQELGAGGGQPNINGDKVAQFRIPMPPYEEQQKIVVQMDTSTRELHSAVAKIDREIELIQEFRTRLVADVVAGQVDVRAISASLPDTPSGVAMQDIHEAVADDDFGADEFGEVG